MASRPTELPPPGAPDVLYLVDLSGYVFRAYHAISPLTSPKGEPTHATYGTVAMLMKLVEERKPAYLALAMDAAGRTFRDDLDARYKAHRPPPPPDLPIQFERCREVAEAYRIPTFSVEGLEADDLIATAVRRARALGLRVVIASSDKDLMQLVEDGSVLLWDPMRDRVFGSAEVREKFGVPPEQVRDLLALVGDSVDNVPGVPSVGLKTAAELLARFGSLEGIYADLDAVAKVRVRESLREHEGEARLSQTLVSLKDDVELSLDLESLRLGKADTERLRALFTELGFTRFLRSLPAPKASGPGKAELLLEPSALEALIAEARARGCLALEVQASSREPMRAHLCGLSLSTREGQAAYLPLGHRYLGVPAQLGLDVVRELLGPLLSDPAVKKIGHDLKFAEVLLEPLGLGFQGAHGDTMLGSYLLDPDAEHTLPAAAARELGLALPPFDEAFPRRRGQPERTLDDCELEAAASWAGPRAEAILRLAALYEARLEAAGEAPLLHEVELPLSHVLAGMERTGVRVDPEALVELGRTMADNLAALEERARELGGAELNLASPRQLEIVLFDQLGLRSSRKTKTGRSTDAEALEAIAEDHPLPGLILEHRAIAKLKSTYVDALPKLVHPQTGRIHTRWSQAVAATGRISSQDPNLQNIPIRTELGRAIRKAFVAPPGGVFLSADYSQIELRVLAHLSGDPVLVDAFRRKQDIHVRTAMEIFGVEAEQVTSDMRRRSKTINFGVIYGMGEQALAKQLGIPRAEASAFIRAYFERYQGVTTFMAETLELARQTGAVTTLLGRRRLLPDLKSGDRMRRAYAERIAQNTPIQGTAADLLKLAMVRLEEPVVPGARMILTVHDELCFEVPSEQAEEAGRAIVHAMESVRELAVPLVVEVGWGPSWAEAH